MRRALVSFLGVGSLLLPIFVSSQSTVKKVGGPCDRCEVMLEGMPSTLGPSTGIAPKQEPGESMTISGILYQKDGLTPASGVILYVYQTDQTGHYAPAPGQTDGRIHGHLRGWMKTDASGYYEFTTIKPGGYPSGDNPAHIHALIKEVDKSIYWIDEYLFDDDPLVTSNVRASQRQRGGSGIIRLRKNEKGVWTGKRDIILGKNIENY